MKNHHYKISADPCLTWEGDLKIVNGSKKNFILVKEENTHTSSLNIDDFYYKITTNLKNDGYKDADKYYMIILIPKEISITKQDLYNVKDPSTGEVNTISKENIIIDTGCKLEDLNF